MAQFPDNRMKPIFSETSRMSAKGSKDLSKLTPEEIQVLVHELTTHQAELSTQNEQLKQIQRELQDSRDKYQQLYDSIPVGYLTINDKCFILEANNTAAEMLGTSRSVLKNSRFTSFIAPTPEFQDIFRLHTKRVFQTAEHLEYELEMQNSGAGFYAHIRTVPVFNDQGQVIQLGLAVTDITKHKKAEEALRKSEEKYRLLYQTMRDGFVRVNMNGSFIESNMAFKDLVGYTETELQALKYWDITPSPWHAMEAKIVEEEILPRGYSDIYEKEYRRKDGTIVPVELCTNLVKEASGVPLEMWAIVRDITGRKADQASLRESEERYRAFFENSIDGILITSLQGNVHFANESACQIFGMSEQELRLASKDGIKNIPDSGIIKAAEELSRAGRFRGELNIHTKDGTLIPAEVSIATFHDGDVKTIIIIRDITDRKKAEEAVRHSQSQLRKFSLYLQEQLELEKKHLAVEIHDELGQMLTALKIDLSWLTKRIPLDLEILSEKTQSMMELINDTDMLVKRISFNLRPPILDDLGLNEALKWWASQFQERTAIKCFLKVPVSEICAKEKAIDVFRIVQEALTNVARHSGATTVRVTMQLESDNLVIAIRDNGKGISKSQIASDSSYGIMGMQERARMLGGVLTIKDNSRKGTVVKLVVPVRE